MSDEKTVVEIDLSKKYIILLEGGLTRADIDDFKRRIDEWLENDKPFLLLNGNDIKLVKVSE